MPDSFADSISLPRKRLVMAVLLVLMLVMAITAGGSLWLVVNEARQLGRPGSHGELWQVYQIRNGMDRLLEEAQHIEQGHSGATQLVVRLGVLRSLSRPVEGHHLFDFLPTARPETTRTLQRVSELSQRWLERVDWNDQASARATSAEILSELPPLQRAMHEVMVAANISLANELDEERQRLYGYFRKLAWALLGLLVGGALLVTHLIYSFREARRLSESLGELAHTLESRVEARTLALSEGRELLKHILEASPSDVALIGAESGRVHFVNQRLIVRQGLQRGSQFSLDRLFAAESEAQRFRAALEARRQIDDWEALLGKTAPYWGVVFGRIVELEGEPAHLVWSYDISLRKRMEHELLTLATTDGLTGLDNRRAFMQRAEDMLRQAERFGHPCSVLMMDIDHFKSVNDGHGHAIGDEALRAVARVMRECLRGVDVLGRLGGEEFAAILPETGDGKAALVAERLRAGVEALRVDLAGGDVLRLTLSLGIAGKRPGETLESLLGRADAALYAAKQAGRNRVEVASL